ncbi:MAG: hypothetical protein ACRCYQ_12385 [Nocardioides sp.]
MTGTLIHTNVLLDIMTDDSTGAEQSVAGLALLTRDPKRYRSYFPAVEVIAPS